MVNILEYFDLYSRVRPDSGRTPGEGGGGEPVESRALESMPAETARPDFPWQFQWLALVLGIMIQPSFASYQAHGEWRFDGLLGWMAFSVITAVIVFPAVYRSTFDPTKPVFLQVIPIFTAGLGWQSLLSTAAVAATHR